jgi:hypothetical protein
LVSPVSPVRLDPLTHASAVRPGYDLRGQAFDPFFVADFGGASSVEFKDGHVTISTWKPGQGERSSQLD